MKKNITKLYTALAFLLFSISAYAQQGRVGINTTDPKTTLDVTGKTDTSGNLLTTDMTGLQAPRLTRAELTAKGNALYGADQKGTLVYITDVSGGDATSQRINITVSGYYYFDGTVWQRLANGGGNGDDKTDDEWINDFAKTRIHLGKKSDGITARDTNTNFIIDDLGRVSIGDYQNATGNYYNAKLYVNDIVTATTLPSGGSRNQGLAVNSDINVTANNAISYRAAELIVSVNNASTANYSNGLVGTRTGFSLLGSGTVASAMGVFTSNPINQPLTNGYNIFGSATFNTNSNVTNFKSISVADYLVSSAQVANYYGIDVSPWTNTSTGGKIVNAKLINISTGNASLSNIQRIDNLYGLYIDPRIDNTNGTVYSIYNNSVSPSYYAGRLGINVNAPAAKIHVVKAATELTPAIIEGCNEYADNAAAVTAGLPIGGLYRTADGTLKVVF